LLTAVLEFYEVAILVVVWRTIDNTVSGLFKRVKVLEEQKEKI